MILDNHGEAVASQVRARSQNNLIETEQYLDLLTGRTFRQSLLIASERMGDVNLALNADRIAQLHFLAPAGLKVDRGTENSTITDPIGRTLTTSVGAVVDALEKMIARFPASSNLDDLSSPKDAQARALISDALYRMVIAGIVHISSEPVIAGPTVSAKPTALPLARADAAAGASFTTNQRHETVGLDPAALVILPVMDGSKDHDALAALLAGAAKAGRLSFNRDGQMITGDKEVAAAAAEMLPGLLAGIAAAGLLVG